MMKSNSSSDPMDPMFTKLNAWGAVERSFSIFSSNLCIFLSISLLILPLAVAMGVVLGILILAEDGKTTATGTSTSATPDFGQLSVGTILMLIVLFVCLIVPFVMMIVAAMIRATAEIYVGEKPQLGAVLQVGFRNICRLFCFGLVLLVPVLGLLLVGALMLSIITTQQSSDGSFSAIGIVLLVVFFPLWFAGWTYIMIPFQMAQPSLILEPTSVTGVVTRAWELASGGRLTIFLATLMLGSISFVVGFIPFVGFLWHLVAMPLSSILATVLFLNLRVEKEGLNRSGLRGELGMDMLDETEMVAAEVYEYESPTKVEKDKHDEIV